MLEKEGMNTIPRTLERGGLQRAAMVAGLAVLMLIMGGLFLPQTAHAAGNFYIENYDIEMQVNQDDTYLITETLDVHFTASSHGIYRVIPYKNTISRDGQTTTFYGKIKDFQMLTDQPVETDRSDSNYFFKIGDPDSYAKEDTTYKYSYVFDTKGDHLSGGDEIYYNLVGTSWEAQSINHVNFRITFPKDIDMNKVGMKTGDDIAVPFETEGNTVIYGSTEENVLRGLTVRAILPEGYFDRQARTTNMLIYILIALMAAATAAGFVLWRKYGKDPQIIETEEFYPPEGMSAPEVAYLETGEMDNKTVTGILLTLADKGYLTITEKEVPYGLKKNKTKTEYEITKVKNYDGTSEDERLFMDGLFEDDHRTTVEMSQLKNKFYRTIKMITDAIDERHKDDLYDDKADTCALILKAIGTVGMIALFLVSKILNGSPFLVGGDDTFVYFAIDFAQIVLPLAAFNGIAKWINKPRRSVLKFILGFLGWAALFFIGFGISYLFDTCMGAQIFPYFIGLIMIFLLFLMAALCERKTDEYAQVLGKIRGYKRFLQVAEKDRMEMLAEQDPDYYYKNLAFAFALGVTAVYTKRFADLAKEPPQWYVGPYYGTGMMFNSAHMVDSMDSMMNSVSSTMVSSPSGSGSGGGGSFSGGGGMGGGGGGSW